MEDLTKIVLIVAAVMLAVYDLAVIAITNGTRSTITNVIWEYSLKYPFIPFGFGLLMGHIFL